MTEDELKLEIEDLKKRLDGYRFAAIEDIGLDATDRIAKLHFRVNELETAIRKHKDQTGHNMCWENDEELWSVLGDNVKIDHTRPPRDEFLQKCKEYCDSRQAGRNPNVNWKLVEEMFGKEEEWKK